MNEPFTSVVEYHTFRGGSIPEVLQIAADWLNAEGLHEDGDIEAVHLGRDSDEGEFHFSILGRYRTNTRLSDAQFKSAENTILKP
jgi:hypothetical protein